MGILLCVQAMYGKLGDLSDLRKQVSSDIKETVSQTTQTAITKELVDQMREVCACVWVWVCVCVGVCVCVCV